MSYGTHYLDGHRRRSVPIAIQPRNKRNKSAKTCNDLRAISFLAPFVRFPQGHSNGHLGGIRPRDGEALCRSLGRRKGMEAQFAEGRGCVRRDAR